MSGNIFPIPPAASENTPLIAFIKSPPPNDLKVNTARPAVKTPMTATIDVAIPSNSPPGINISLKVSRLGPFINSLMRFHVSLSRNLISKPRPKSASSDLPIVIAPAPNFSVRPMRPSFTPANPFCIKVPCFN